MVLRHTLCFVIKWHFWGNVNILLMLQLYVMKAVTSRPCTLAPLARALDAAFSKNANRNYFLKYVLAAALKQKNL